MNTNLLYSLLSASVQIKAVQFSMGAHNGGIGTTSGMARPNWQRLPTCPTTGGISQGRTLQSLNLPSVGLLDLNVRENVHEARHGGHCLPTSMPGSNHQHTSKLNNNPGFKSDATQLVFNEERHLQQVCHYEKDIGKLHEISYQVSRVWNMERIRLGIPPIQQNVVFEKMVELVRPTRSLDTSPRLPINSDITGSVTNRYAKDAMPTSLSDSTRCDLRTSFLDKYRNDDKSYNVDNLCHPRDGRPRHNAKERRGRRNVEKRIHHSYDDKRHSNASKPYAKSREVDGRPSPHGGRAQILNGNGLARFRREDRAFKKDSSTSPRHELQGDSSSRESSVSPCVVRHRKLSHSSSYSELSLGRSPVVNDDDRDPRYDVGKVASGSDGQLQRSQSAIELFSYSEQSKGDVCHVKKSPLVSPRGRTLEGGAKQAQQKPAKDEDTPRISKSATVGKLKNGTKLPLESHDVSPCDREGRPSMSSCEVGMSNHPSQNIAKAEQFASQGGGSVRRSSKKDRSEKPLNACKFEDPAPCTKDRSKPRPFDPVSLKTDGGSSDSSFEKKAQILHSPVTSEVAHQGPTKLTDHVEDKMELTVNELPQDGGNAKLGSSARIVCGHEKDSRMAFRQDSKQDSSATVESSKLSHRPKSREEDCQSITELKAPAPGGCICAEALINVPITSSLPLVVSELGSIANQVAKISTTVNGADCSFFKPHAELQKVVEPGDITLCSASTANDLIPFSSSAMDSSTEHSLEVIDKGQHNDTVLATDLSNPSPVLASPQTLLSPNLQSYQPPSQARAFPTLPSPQLPTSPPNFGSCQLDGSHTKGSNDSLRKTPGNTSPALPPSTSQVKSHDIILGNSCDAQKDMAGQTCLKSSGQTRLGNDSEMLGSAPFVTMVRRETTALQPVKRKQKCRLEKCSPSSVCKPQQSNKSDEKNLNSNSSVSCKTNQGDIPTSTHSAPGPSTASLPLLVDSSLSTSELGNLPSFDSIAADPKKLNVDHVAGVLVCNSPQATQSFLDTESNVEVLVMSSCGPSEWICEPLTPVDSDEGTSQARPSLPTQALSVPVTEAASPIASPSLSLPLSSKPLMCSSVPFDSIVTTSSTTDNRLLSPRNHRMDSMASGLQAPDRKEQMSKRRSSLESPGPAKGRMQPLRQSSCPTHFSFSCCAEDRLLEGEDKSSETIPNGKLFESGRPLGSVMESNTSVDIRANRDGCVIDSNCSKKITIAETSTSCCESDKPHEVSSQQQYVCKTSPPSKTLLPATISSSVASLQEGCANSVPCPSAISTVALNTPSKVTTALLDHRTLTLDAASGPCSIMSSTVTSAKLITSDSSIGCTDKNTTALQEGEGIYTLVPGSTTTKSSFSGQSVARPATLSIKCYRSKPREVMSAPTVAKTKDQIYQEIFGRSGALAIRSPPGLAKLTGSKLQKGRKRKERMGNLQTGKTEEKDSLSEGQAIKKAPADMASKDASLERQSKRRPLERGDLLAETNNAIKDAKGRGKRRRKGTLDSCALRRVGVSAGPGQVNGDRTHYGSGRLSSTGNPIVMPRVEDIDLPSKPHGGNQEHKGTKSEKQDNDNLPRKRKKNVNAVASKKRHRMSTDSKDSSCSVRSKSVAKGANDERSVELPVESLLLSPLVDDKAVPSNIFDLMTTTDGKKGKASKECLEILGCSMEKEEYASIRALCKRYNRELEKKQEEVKLLKSELGRTESQLLRMTELTNNQDKKIVELTKGRAEISKQLRANENATTKLKDSIAKKEQNLEEKISQITDSMNSEIQKLKEVIEKHVEENELQRKEIDGLVEKQKVLEETNKNQAMLVAELRREVEQKAGQINDLAKKAERHRSQCKEDLDKTSNLPFALHMFLNRYLGTRLCPAPPTVVKEEKTESEKESGSSEIAGQD